MNVSISENARRTDTTLLDAASKQLEGILGKSRETVTAEWGQHLDANGRPVYTLKLADFTGEVAAEFTSSELQSPRQMRSRLLELWGDLLQVRSHRLLEKLTEPASHAGE